MAGSEYLRIFSLVAARTLLPNAGIMGELMEASHLAAANLLFILKVL